MAARADHPLLFHVRFQLFPEITRNSPEFDPKSTGSTGCFRPTPAFQIASNPFKEKQLAPFVQ
jgi:hypothetical protein